MEKGKIKVLIADDHALFREGLKRIINLESDIEVVKECTDGNAVLNYLTESTPDVILMDINMPNLNGVEATKEALRKYPDLKIIILSIHDDEAYVFQTLKNGAKGYLLKDMEASELIEAIRLVHNGKAYIHPKVTGKLIDEFRRLSEIEKESEVKAKDSFALENLLTRREIEVLELLVRGKSNRAIAETIFISEKTVKNHVSSILAKLNVDDRTQAVLLAIKNNWFKL